MNIHNLNYLKRNIIINVEIHCNASLQYNTIKINDIYGNNCNVPLQSNENNIKNNLSNIIRGFKSSSTKLIHISGFNTFAWQPIFYENIIKNEKSLQNIREYILNNPINWSKDENNIDSKLKWNIKSTI